MANGPTCPRKGAISREFLPDPCTDFFSTLQERNGLLSLNNDDTYVGSGGFGWTRELPQPDFGTRARSGHRHVGFRREPGDGRVSPEMFAEFIFPYQLPFLERFGLNCYGCCEPLDKRWHVVQRVPRLRRVSVSAWANMTPWPRSWAIATYYLGSPPRRPGDGHFDEDAIGRTSAMRSGPPATAGWKPS